MKLRSAHPALLLALICCTATDAAAANVYFDVDFDDLTVGTTVPVAGPTDSPPFDVPTDILFGNPIIAGPTAGLSSNSLLFHGGQESSCCGLYEQVLFEVPVNQYQVSVEFDFLIDFGATQDQFRLFGFSQFYFRKDGVFAPGVVFLPYAEGLPHHIEIVATATDGDALWDVWIDRQLVHSSNCCFRLLTTPFFQTQDFRLSLTEADFVADSFVYVDNLRIEGIPLPEPGSAVTIAALLVALCAAASRQRRPPR